MGLYAISDLHLSFASGKPMDVFGNNWELHYEKIERFWSGIVSVDDTVIIAGDISWGDTLENASPDLEFLDRLAGRKIVTKGNHDFWWKSLKKNTEAFPNINFIQNNFVDYGEYAICGSRGWLCPEANADSESFSSDDKRIYERELTRLRLSFGAAKRAGFTKFICVLHYPPFDISSGEFSSGFTEIIDCYGAEHCVFGHLHNVENSAWKNGAAIGGCRYWLTSCDFLDFKPIQIRLLS